ncbi:MAG TPA: glycerophosphodiester phosphodiesterase [Solirubrobacterales bacterium]|nr:glycerophosphodiester phosphodiesterase [Solirubrobacterales bacterium]
MAGGEKADRARRPGDASRLRRVGHKGADEIVHGNTIESFQAAVEHGVDMIEFDVLRAREGRLIVAHDYEDALTRRPLTLSEALDAFSEPPLDKVEIDCDLKLPGREAELAGALQGHGLVERAMVSTMEIESLQKLRQLEPDLRLGWTFPKTRRDWTSHRSVVPILKVALAAMRRQFPKAIGERTERLGLSAIWAYHQVVTRRAVEAAREADVELIAWTVDDLGRMTELIEMGVEGIVSNDPRLFDRAERAAAGTVPKPEPEEPDVMEDLDEEAEPAAEERS